MAKKQQSVIALFSTTLPPAFSKNQGKSGEAHPPGPTISAFY
jgi:hypothetical protein